MYAPARGAARRGLTSRPSRKVRYFAKKALPELRECCDGALSSGGDRWLRAAGVARAYLVSVATLFMLQIGDAVRVPIAFAVAAPPLVYAALSMVLLREASPIRRVSWIGEACLVHLLLGLLAALEVMIAGGLPLSSGLAQIFVLFAPAPALTLLATPLVLAPFVGHLTTPPQTSRAEVAPPRPAPPSPPSASRPKPFTRAAGAGAFAPPATPSPLSTTHCGPVSGTGRGRGGLPPHLSARASALHALSQVLCSVASASGARRRSSTAGVFKPAAAAASPAPPAAVKPVRAAFSACTRRRQLRRRGSTCPPAATSNHPDCSCLPRRRQAGVRRIAAQPCINPPPRCGDAVPPPTPKMPVSVHANGVFPARSLRRAAAARRPSSSPPRAEP